MLNLSKVPLASLLPCSCRVGQHLVDYFYLLTQLWNVLFTSPILVYRRKSGIIEVASGQHGAIFQWFVSKRMSTRCWATLYYLEQVFNYRRGISTWGIPSGQGILRHNYLNWAIMNIWLRASHPYSRMLKEPVRRGAKCVNQRKVIV